MKNKFLNGRFYRCKKLVLVILVIITLVSGISFLWWNNTKTISAQESFNSYVNAWNKQDFTLMYNMIDAESRKKISETDFVQRYKNIYSGIELKEIDVKIKDSEKKKYDSSIESIKFEVIMDTIAGKLTFNNTGELIKDSKNKTWKILWSSKMIFPELENEDKIRVATLNAKRGEIKDKKDKILALDGTVAEIDIVPGKLGNDAAKSKENVSKILQVSLEDINKKLSATYVKPDMSIPIKTISEGETEKINVLLKIPGVMVNEKKARVYPLKEKAAHLIGYIQAISAEEIEKNKEEGYKKDDIIGKTGLEKIYEKTLRGKNGYEIYVVDKNNKKKKSLISKAVQNGEDLKLTIDANMQSLLYDELSKDA